MSEIRFSQQILYGLIAKALELPADFALRPEISPEQVPGWDSLAWINILNTVERQWGIEFPLESLSEIKVLGELESVTEFLVDGGGRV